MKGRIAFVGAELAVTDAQTPQWNAFADALRARSKAKREMMAKHGDGATGKTLDGGRPNRRYSADDDDTA